MHVIAVTDHDSMAGVRTASFALWASTNHWGLALWETSTGSLTGQEHVSSDAWLPRKTPCSADLRPSKFAVSTSWSTGRK